LRTINQQGQLGQAASAIGGSRASISVAPDLVFMLMLQNGAKMISNDGSSAIFNSGGQGTNGGNPGLAAFNFYLQFANSASPYYTWNDAMGDDVQSFIAGKTAIMFDYSATVSRIQQKAPFLNFGVAPMLQPSNATIAVNYPKYTGLAVSRQGRVNDAWQFVLFATTDSNGQKVYVKDTGRLPASRNYIAANLSDPVYGAFASQALTARSWREADDTKIDAILDTAIQNVLNGTMDSAHALGVAQGAVTAVMQNR
jgi:ABC-type glycerol-3-phosphate transport system substrate-binding protein